MFSMKIIYLPSLIIAIILKYSESEFLYYSETSINNIFDEISNLTPSKNSENFNTLSFVDDTIEITVPNGTEFESSDLAIDLSNQSDTNKFSETVTKGNIDHIKVEPLTSHLIEHASPLNDRASEKNMPDEMADNMSKGFFLLKNMQIKRSASSKDANLITEDK
ncbi:hypothetical protein JTE90_019807 [Oedothorax gibbosus]|uniref:Uncharacterized protein n=1 Tax=Oedothorax gibbosus TaxID=931172 RepID=A0AAV6V5W3_9ARAC|nr:hypothetical protein JTE90_019807 [Oedothorax gibbosus]